MRRAVDATRLKFRHHTWGPTDLFYGDLYASREVPCKSTSIPGDRDPYAACCAAELMKEDGFDFLLLSLPDNDNYSHRHGPEASVESIAKADDCFGTLVEAGGRDRPLPRGARGDPGRRPRPDRRSTAACRWPSSSAAEWSVLQPSEDRPELAQLAVSPTGRAAHVYLLPGEGERGRPGGGRGAAGARSRASTWSAGCEAPRARRCARESRGCRRPATSGRWSSAAASGCASGPAPTSPTCAAGAGRSRGSSAALEATDRGRQAAQRRLPRPAGSGSGRR